MNHKTLIKRTARQILTDMVCNPDGSGSTKRTAGWVLTLSSFIFGVICTHTGVVDQGIFSTVFVTAFTGGLGCFGLSSVDTRSYFDAMKSAPGAQQAVSPPAPQTPAQPSVEIGDLSNPPRS